MSTSLIDDFRNPPREFSLMPFWFWNDELDEGEIGRQIRDFAKHGVYGFVIHPRVGLPRDIGWMSERMIHFMKFAVAEAKRWGMRVILYDDGMYPSGSSSGQVVASDSALAARMLDKIDLEPGQEPGWNLVAILERPGGERVAVVDRPSRSMMRGIHYIDEDQATEDRLPVADILNPEATAKFIELVYDRYYAELGEFFGDTILAIFTDEPRMSNGTTGILAEVERILGYDFTPYLADLWYEDSPESLRRRAEYQRAIAIRVEETYYRPLSEWCERHGVALTGHPAGSMDIGMLRYFQIPGQDLVWRYVEPGPKALEGEHSTMAKIASSAMIHLGRRRNSNELYGAYGHELTFDEVKWLANWCFVRGQNLLYPHAFYYSVRGPRRNERPPDVGPNSAWWGEYKPYADSCRRLSWLNTDSEHVCDIAILADARFALDGAAKVLYQHQRDFNYLELRHLWEDAEVDADGVRIAGMLYAAVVLDGLPAIPDAAREPLKLLRDAGRLIEWDGDEAKLLAGIDRLVAADVRLTPPSPDIRIRHVVKSDRHFYLLFNEGSEVVTVAIALAVDGEQEWWDPASGEVMAAPHNQPITFQPHEMKVLCVSS